MLSARRIRTQGFGSKPGTGRMNQGRRASDSFFRLSSGLRGAGDAATLLWSSPAPAARRVRSTLPTGFSSGCGKTVEFVSLLPTGPSPMASHPLWSQIQRKLQQQLAPEEYATWFRPLRARTEGSRRLVLIAPNERFLSTLEESYRPAVDRAIAGLAEPGFEVLFALAGAHDVEVPAVSAKLEFNP